MTGSLVLREATPDDVSLIVRFIRDLADYERLSDACVATEDLVRSSLFGTKRYAEVLIAEWNDEPAGFALFFHNYSTFLARPGIYLEDLYVRPELRGHGIGKALLTRLASVAVARGCGRLEWAVLNWNESAIGFYRSLGALPQDEWQVYRLTGDSLTKLAESAR